VTRPRFLVIAALAAFALALLPAAQCGQTAVATIPSDVALVQCVLSTYATDSAAGMSAAAIASDELAKCGSDAGTIASIVDAHEAANAKMGIVLQAPGAVGAALRAHSDAGPG
jgi:hypothetical protein